MEQNSWKANYDAINGTKNNKLDGLKGTSVNASISTFGIFTFHWHLLISIFVIYRIQFNLRLFARFTANNLKFQLICIYDLNKLNKITFKDTDFINIKIDRRLNLYENRFKHK